MERQLSMYSRFLNKTFVWRKLSKTHLNAPVRRFKNRGIIYRLSNKNAVACNLVHDTAIILYKE